MTIHNASADHNHRLLLMEEYRQKRAEQWAADEHKEFLYNFKEELQSVLDFYRASIRGEILIDGEKLTIKMKGVRE